MRRSIPFFNGMFEFKNWPRWWWRKMSENSPIHVFPSPSPDSLCSLSPLFQHGQSWPSLPSWWCIFIWNSTLTYRRDAHGYCGCLFFAKLSAGKIAAKFTQYLQLWVWLRPNISAQNFTTIFLPSNFLASAVSQLHWPLHQQHRPVNRSVSQGKARYKLPQCVKATHCGTAQDS